MSDDELRKWLIEEYMDIAKSFYFEGSDETDERNEFAPLFADKVMEKVKARDLIKDNEILVIDTNNFVVKSKHDKI